MTAAERQAWLDANQRYLTASIAYVRAALIEHANQSVSPISGVERSNQAVEQELRAAAGSLQAPSALDALCAVFGLSLFERHVLLLCAGVELNSDFADACALAQRDRRRTHPSFSLALETMPDAHWSAITAVAPLRRWRLIDVGPGETLTTSPLRIDEPILHYLTGIPYADDRLLGFVKRVTVPQALSPTYRALAERIESLWSRDTQSADRMIRPVIQLCGSWHRGKRPVAAAACSALGLRLRAMRMLDIPTATAEREALVRLWDREALLTRSALLLDCDDVELHERPRAAASFIEAVQGLVVVTTREPLPIETRQSVRVDVQRPPAREQHQLWTETLHAAGHEVNGGIDAVASHFDLDPQDIREVCAAAAADRTHPARPLDAAIWDACRTRSRTRLDDLAQRIESRVTWDDLVLPDLQRQTLTDIAAHVRHRFTVYETWGFAARSDRGLGMSALFAGASGTGKTMAAEVLANDLQLDLYRIDLSQVVSKYIGETEKNLRRVFDAAEAGGAVLLFDEADALFGKRSEVKDSHDRYANVEVSYLLQRMESYRGLAILATNMKSALDPAFLRRIRFIVQFPFPDRAQRTEIWRRMFPAVAPTEGLDVSMLGRLNVTGGTIRNIALNAAFCAADAGTSMRMRDLLKAARNEYAKLEKPLTDQEVAGWR